MQVMMAAVGLCIILLVLWDVVATTLLLRGAGPLTSRLTDRWWKICLALHRRLRREGFLSICGGLIILSSIAVWIVLYWAGWTLLFSLSSGSVLESQQEVPANFWQRAYYVGFTFITLGVGDFKAGNELWEMLSIVLAISGFFLVTLIITYLLPVVSAVVEQRQLGVQIQSMSYARGTLLLSFERLPLSRLIQQLLPLTEKISRLGQQQLAYPVLHFMQTSNANASLPLALAELDETLTLLLTGMADPPSELDSLLPLRHSLTFYLRTLRSVRIPLRDSPPPLLLLDKLNAFGDPVEHGEFADRLAQLGKRRAILNGYIAYTGWEWQDVLRIRTYEEAELNRDAGSGAGGQTASCASPGAKL